MSVHRKGFQVHRTTGLYCQPARERERESEKENDGERERVKESERE